MIERTGSDAESVIGEEAHIVSGSPGGPRYDPQFPVERIDDLDNIVLLCGVHHKQIDDQVGAHPADVVRGLKQRHENWVGITLASNGSGAGVPRVKRIKQNIPERLNRISSGKALMDLVAGSYGTYMDHEERLSDQETELVGEFFQELRDWADVWEELEPIDRLRAVKSVQDRLDQIEKTGFLVFAGTEMQRLEGGKYGPEDWPVRHVAVLRKTNERIVFSPNPQ